jgi:hypothetical protein
VDTALQSVVQSAAGTGAPTNPTSRYYGSPVLTLTRADSAQIAYLQRRIVPQPAVYTSLMQYPVVDGDRLDNLASRFLGDPLLYWIICDANGTADPEDLTSEVGRAINIPLASGIPPGARNG